MSAAEWLRLLVLLHGLCWIGSLCLTTLLPGYMSRICAQLWPAEYTRFQPFSIETSCPLTALQYMQLRLLLREGSLRLSTLWPRLNNALQNLTTPATPALWIVGQEEERVPADFYLALKTSDSCCIALQYTNRRTFSSFLGDQQLLQVESRSQSSHCVNGPCFRNECDEKSPTEQHNQSG